MSSITHLWDTYDEIQYIDKSIKRLNDPAYTSLTGITYKEFLENYLKTSALRKNWKGIKKNIVIDFVTQYLEDIDE